MQVLIVDDESLARMRLQKMLAELPGFDCIGEASNGQQALEKIAALNPDIVLLDIRMPGMDGMEVAKKLAEVEHAQDCRVIFTTAYEEYALQAFESQASGYLVKPVNKEKLRRALEQAARVSSFQLPEHRQHLSANSRGKIDLIPLKDVRVLYAEHKYVTLYHTGGESILDDSLKDLELEFDGIFVRVHRNALVSMPHVSGMEKNKEGQYQLLVDDVEVKPVVSRRLATEIKKMMRKM
ncbi:MAG: response regulator transcription factor [Pseudomonadales bacterium]|nr:response regulator transcription factor [Pseudomonadales bacterium]